MITFKPAGLRQRLVEALRLLDKFAEISLNDWPQMHEPGFDFKDTKDTTITARSEFAFEVGADESPTLTVKELIELSEELPQSKVVNHELYVSPNRVYARIESVNDAATQFVNHINEYATSTTTRFETSSGRIRLALVNGFTPFAIHMKKLGEYDDDMYPTFNRGDVFIEARFPAGTSEAEWRALIPAFLFELEEQTGMAFVTKARPKYDDLWPEEYDEDEYLKQFGRIRMRPLMSGPGVESLMRLYERAIARDGDPEQHFVGFIKVIEYVSATVVNTERNAQLRRRLLSPKALSPDAGFIRDLGFLFESLRNFRKDAEALRLTVEVCCDPVELAPHAPKHQRLLAAVTEASPAADRKRALDALSATFSATRNMFSHAKANYALTGEECPDEDLPQLTKCARVAARQSARWFAHSDTSLRVAD